MCEGREGGSGQCVSDVKWNVNIGESLHFKYFTHFMLSSYSLGRLYLYSPFFLLMELKFLLKIF